MSELKSYYYYEDRVFTPATHCYRVYHADKADKVIAELKARIRELESMPHTDNSAVIDALEKENDVLKKELAELRDATRWRKCSEELPEKDKYVLAFCPNLESIEIARIIDDEWRDFSWNYLEVTHWMPLPKAPEDK